MLNQNQLGQAWIYSFSFSILRLIIYCLWWSWVEEETGDGGCGNMLRYDKLFYSTFAFPCPRIIYIICAYLMFHLYPIHLSFESKVRSFLVALCSWDKTSKYPFLVCLFGSQNLLWQPKNILNNSQQNWNSFVKRDHLHPHSIKIKQMKQNI